VGKKKSKHELPESGDETFKRFQRLGMTRRNDQLAADIAALEACGAEVGPAQIVGVGLNAGPTREVEFELNDLCGSGAEGVRAVASYLRATTVSDQMIKHRELCARTLVRAGYLTEAECADRANACCKLRGSIVSKLEEGCFAWMAAKWLIAEDEMLSAQGDIERAFASGAVEVGGTSSRTVIDRLGHVVANAMEIGLLMERINRQLLGHDGAALQAYKQRDGLQTGRAEAVKTNSGKGQQTKARVQAVYEAWIAENPMRARFGPERVARELKVPKAEIDGAISYYKAGGIEKHLRKIIRMLK
jgi:hypothetical protein